MLGAARGAIGHSGAFILVIGLLLSCCSGMFKAHWIVLLSLTVTLGAKEMPELPAELSAYVLDPVTSSGNPLLQRGDRLAICGDSITEQHLYSVLIETYLTACHPEMEVSCRQFGWSGEQAEGFLKRMRNDVLRFKPTIATTCYGMNDFHYVPYDDAIAANYRKNQTAVADCFKETGCRVILGSPGIIDSVPHWVKQATGTKEDLNLALSKFRNITLEVAEAEHTGFADIYRPMLLANLAMKQRYGEEFKLAGNDGVHPAWAGHVVMAYAFLKALGVDGGIGTITWDEASDKAAASAGHEVVSCVGGKLSLRSSKLPLSAGPGDAAKDNTIRAGLGLVPFDDELNRFILKITHPKAKSYTVTWGGASKQYTAEELTTGVNLAKDFENPPTAAAFAAIQDAVAAKQVYETRQIKNLVHGPEGGVDAEATFALTEKTRKQFVDAVRAACKPADHELQVTPSDAADQSGR